MCVPSKVFTWILVYFVFLVACQIDDSQSKVLCVKPNGNYLSPYGIPETQCQTLDLYRQNINTWFTSNTTMNFLDGHHSLRTFIQVTNCHNFTMTGVGSIMVA